MRELFRRVDQQYYLSEYVHYNIGGLSTQYQLSEYAQLIYIRGLSTKWIIGVCPLFISEGCPRVNTNAFVWKSFSFMEKCMFEGVSEDLIHGA